MDISLALITAGSIFGFVALMHLLRLIYKLPILIAGKVIPLWVSILGCVVGFSLSIWMFLANYSM